MFSRKVSIILAIIALASAVLLSSRCSSRWASKGASLVKRTAFDLFHPVVALAYFAILLVMSMAAMQPCTFWCRLRPRSLLARRCAALVPSLAPLHGSFLLSWSSRWRTRCSRLPGPPSCFASERGRSTWKLRVRCVHGRDAGKRAARVLECFARVDVRQDHGFVRRRRAHGRLMLSMTARLVPPVRSPRR